MPELQYQVDDTMGTSVRPDKESCEIKNPLSRFKPKVLYFTQSFISTNHCAKASCKVRFTIAIYQLTLPEEAAQTCNYVITAWIRMPFEFCSCLALHKYIFGHKWRGESSQYARTWAPPEVGAGRLYLPDVECDVGWRYYSHCCYRTVRRASGREGLFLHTGCLHWGWLGVKIEPYR